MISANELRIGNWISIGTEKYGFENVEVFAIDDTGINFEPGVAYDSVDMDYKVKFYPMDGDKIIKPIELTEEILLKCGFEKEVKDYNGLSVVNFKLKGWLPFLKEMKLNQCKWYQVYNVADCHISYLHQLQNLYFALTGKELNVKL